MKRELAENVEGLRLVIFAASDERAVQRLEPVLRANSSLTPEGSSLFQHLFLTLTFSNGSSFSARACYPTSRLFVLFQLFFPTDTGPLPAGTPLTIEQGTFAIEEGFHLLLPFQQEPLQTIRAQFLVLPQQEG
jgi:hypothetical protein